MNVRFMQLVDFWVGVPLCAFLSLVYWLAGLVSPRSTNSPRKVLFIELSEMGSAILAYSSINYAQNNFENSQIYFLVFSRNREGVELLNALPKDNIIVVEDTSFLAFAKSVLHSLIKIRKLGIDTTVDLELFSRFTAIFSLLSGAKNRAGFYNHTDEGLFRGTFFTHHVLYNNLQHMSLNFLALILSLKEEGGKTEPLIKGDMRPHLVPLPEFSPSSEQQGDIRTLLKNENPDITEDSRLVVFNPDPGLLPLRGWAIENYAELAKRIGETLPSAYIVVIGLDRSANHAKSISEAVGEGRCLDLTGKTASIAEVLVLLSTADALVTSDSGPAHIASLTKIHNLVLFGPESPVRYAPMGENTKTFYANYSCSPCYSAANHRHSMCSNNKCMKALTVDAVYAELQGCL